MAGLKVTGCVIRDYVWYYWVAVDLDRKDIGSKTFGGAGALCRAFAQMAWGRSCRPTDCSPKRFPPTLKDKGREKQIVETPNASG
jgi:hypothetical protein